MFNITQSLCDTHPVRAIGETLLVTYGVDEYPFEG